MVSSLVVGFGSIGGRHARLLREMGHEVGVVSRRKVDWLPLFPDLYAALAEAAPAYVVIANDTAAHGATLRELAERDFRGRVLVEKPLFATPEAVPEARFERLAVGYQLRFHAGVERLKAALDGERVVAACFYVGQALADWRPGRDYRTSESARRERGGGALRDLSHELDLALWLFGECRQAVARGGKWSDLEIDSDDTWAILLECAACPAVTLQMNYLSRPGRRFIIVESNRHSFELDLVAGRFAIDGRAEPIMSGRDDVLKAMHRTFIDSSDGPLCSLEEGLAVTRLIAAIERSAATQTWQAP